MRLNLCEDEDFNNQAMLWEANQERSLRGRRGQAALRELESALLALPEKRLIADELENERGEVCAVGALAKYKGHENPMIGDAFGDNDELSVNEGEIERVTVQLAEEMGMPHLVALAVVYQNDDSYVIVTPEQRYDKVLRWARHWLGGHGGWLTKAESKTRS